MFNQTKKLYKNTNVRQQLKLIKIEAGKLCFGLWWYYFVIIIYYYTVSSLWYSYINKKLLYYIWYKCIMKNDSWAR